MNKICTSIEQSQKLIELGIDVNTADMYYPNRVRGNNYPLPIDYKMGIPLLSQEIACWSLSALLELLDYPQLSKDKLGSGRIGWMVSVYPDNCRYDSCWHDNPIDACVKMIIKLNELKIAQKEE